MIWPCMWLSLVLMGLGCVAPPASAAAPIHAHVEVGFGSTTVRPLEVQTAGGASIRVGLNASLTGPLRLGLEFAESAGGDLVGGSYIPESSRPGNRALTTVVLGLELGSRTRRAGPFTFVGAGVGRGTLSGATGIFAPPYDRWLEPSRHVIAFAVGAGAGYRFAGGPGPLGVSLALRTQLLVHARQVAASTTMVTVGLAY